MTLKEARRLTKLTQNMLEEAAALGTTAVSDIEIGRVGNPSHETVFRIIRALQRSGLPGITSQDIDEFRVEDEELQP